LRINRNIVANYSSRLWAGLSTFVFIPLYLRILGPEAFGLVTFGASILGLVFVLDMGLSNAFAREAARNTDRQALANLLRSLEILYLGIIALVAILAILTAGMIADQWLNASELAPERLRWSVGLMLCAAILQVMMSLYIGGLLGSNRHVAAAGYQIGFGLLRSGVVLIPLYFWPFVELVFAWQLVTALICLMFLRRTMWRTIRSERQPHFSGAALNQVRGFAGGMFLIALVSAINMQSDKLVVSKMFALDELGRYAIAALVGQVPSMLALPLAVTVLPRLTNHIAHNERPELTAIYMRYSYMISAAAFTAALGIFVGAPQILTLLQGSDPSAEFVTVCRILTAGGAFLAAQFMPYHLAIASGHTRTNVIFGTISAVSLPVAMFLGAMQCGLVGAAIPWMLLNVAAAIFLAWWITPRFLGPHLGEWAWKTNAVPLVTCAAAISPAIFVLPGVTDPLASVAIVALFCGAATAINAAMLTRLFRDSSRAHPRRFEIAP
jgi:O-antigen/teichoic acid export membrane protein